MDDIYKNIEEYDSNKKRKIWSVFEDIIFDMLSNENINPLVAELFIRGRKLIISFVFVTQSCFAVPNNIRLNYTNYFIMKIPNKRDFQQTIFNHSSDIDLKDFMNLHKKMYCQNIFLLVIDATLTSDNLSRFRKNLLERI